MVQQNGNKQHFTINSAASSNPANRTLESIYHTFNFVFSVRPEVKLDVHPCGLDRICEHPCATKLTQGLTEWWVYHCRDECCTPEVTDNCGAGRIHALMMASSVSTEHSVKGARQVSPIPTWHQQRRMPLHATYYNYAIIYFHNLATLPPPPPHQTPLKWAVKNKSKLTLTLPCGRTATSQRQFGCQNVVLHDIGWSENGALLGTRAQTVTESQTKW